MANRRMFNREIVSSDKFIEMPISSQALFFHLGMNADDEGFVSSPKRVQRSIGCSDDDIKILIAKHFVRAFSTGILVVVNWDKHNLLRSDRRKETIHIEEKRELQLIDIEECQPSDNQESTKRVHSIVEYSIEESSIVKPKAKRFSPPTSDEVKQYCLDKKYDIDAVYFCDYYISNGWKVGKNPMKDWKATVRQWNSRNNKQEVKEVAQPKNTGVFAQ